MHQPQVDWSTTVEVADWIAQRLHPFDAHDVGSILPSGFPAYARILHPASRLKGNDEIKVRWAELAAWSGRVVHPQMQFETISQENGELTEPDIGTLTLDEVIALEGGIEVPPVAPESVLSGPCVRLPQRDYLLYSGPITAALRITMS